MEQISSPPSLPQNPLPQGKPKWYRNLSLAMWISLGFFIIINGLNFALWIGASDALVKGGGLAGLLIFPLLGVAFIYLTIVVPLWIYLLRKLFQHNVVISGLAVFFQPYFIIQFVGTLFAFIPQSEHTGLSFVDKLEIVGEVCIFLGLAKIFYDEFQHNRRLKKQNQVQLPPTPVAQPVQQQPSQQPEIVQTTVPSSHLHMFIFLTVASLINFVSFYIWYGIAIVPFVYLAYMGGSTFPYMISLFGIYFPQYYLILLLELPLAAFIIKKIFKKKLSETYLNTLLILLVTSLIFVIISVILQPQQVKIPSKPTIVTQTYDFTKPLILNTANHQVGDIALGPNLAAWDEYVKSSSADNVSDTFIFQFDPLTGKGSTTRITDREFSPRAYQGAWQGSLKIINDKVYWEEQGTDRVLFSYDPSTGKTTQLDPNTSEYANKCDANVNENDGTVDFNSDGIKGNVSDTIFDYYVVYPLACSNKYMIYGFSQRIGGEPSGFAVYNIQENKTVYQDIDDDEVDEAKLFGDTLFFRSYVGTKVYELDIPTQRKQLVLEKDNLFSWDTDGKFLLYRIDLQGKDYGSELYLQKLPYK